MEEPMITAEPGIYQHTKSGKKYRVLSTARHSETQEFMVVYRALHGEYGLWVLPAKMFLEEVTMDNQKVPRFKRVISKF